MYHQINGAHDSWEVGEPTAEHTIAASDKTDYPCALTVKEEKSTLVLLFKTQPINLRIFGNSYITSTKALKGCLGQL